MKKDLIALLITLSCFSGLTQAAALPKSAGFDGRVQHVTYNPGDVTVVRTQAGKVTLIQLGEDEYIKGSDTGLGVGDPMAWNIQVRANNIFLRPVADEPDTNVAVVTNKHTYSLLLTTAKTQPTFVLRYVYPKPPEPVKQTVFLGKSKVKFPCSEGNFVNLRYEVKGSQKIRPNAVWDDGRFTCLRWDSSVDLPVAFRILPDGNEQLVNTHMEKNVMVVHEVTPELVLRLGNEVLQVRTQHNVARGYNEKGTTTGEERVEK